MCEALLKLENLKQLALYMDEPVSKLLLATLK